MLYKNANNDLFVNPIVSNHKGLVEITQKEFDAILEAKNKPTPEQIEAKRVQEAKSYLDSTDWYITRFAETGIEIPQEVKTKRLEARLSI